MNIKHILQLFSLLIYENISCEKRFRDVLNTKFNFIIRRNKKFFKKLRVKVNECLGLGMN